MSETQRFQKKPVVVEAMQFDGSEESIEAIHLWSGGNLGWVGGGDRPIEDAFVSTLEGDMSFGEGDWIVRGVAGEFYPVKPDIFAATYVPTYWPAPAVIQDSPAAPWAS